MALTNPGLWDLISTWHLPDFPASPSWFNRGRAVSDFETRLGNDLVLLPATARGLVLAYRQWLYVCAVAGHRVQPSDIVLEVESLHRQAQDDWRRLTDALPDAALVGERVRRVPANDAEYQATLDYLSTVGFGGVRDQRFWPEVWRYRVERQTGKFALVALALLAIGGGPLWLFEPSPGIQPALLAICFAGAAGVLAWLGAWAVLTAYLNDDQG